LSSSIDSGMFRKQYSTVSEGDANWQKLQFPEGNTYGWEADSTYIRKAPYFDGMGAQPEPVKDIHGARVLAVLGDSVTTDHISPAGSIKKDGPAGKYLTEHGVKPADFNSYGSRRGNHEVMVRGTFANVRLRNKLAPGTEGGVTRLLPEGTGMSIYDASVEYAKRNTPLCILPLQFLAGQNAESLGLTGEEVYKIGDQPGQLRAMLDGKFANGKLITVIAESDQGRTTEFQAVVRIDTPQEILYYQHGGILQYVLRQLAGKA